MFEFIKLKQSRYYLALLVGSALCFSSISGIRAEPSAAQAPDFALRSVDGDNLRLSEFRGSVVLLGFWARWCGDCRLAMQALNEVNTKYARAGLVTLGINVDDTLEQAVTMTHSLALTYPVLFDANRQVSGLFNLKAMPQMVLIDREGRVRFNEMGFERGQEQLITEHLRQLLSE